MDSFKIKLNKSRSDFARHSRTLVSSARRAGVAFLGDSGKATRKFGGFVRKETESWASYVTARSTALRSANIITLDFTPGLQRGLLVRLARALDALRSRVGDQLDTLERGDGPSGELRGDDLPWADYETRTARAIVAGLDGLSEAECRAVYEFEQQNKRRATVIRALEARLTVARAAA